MKTIIAWLFLLAFLNACKGEHIRPYAQYDARFGDDIQIELIEMRLRTIAQQNKLKIAEKNRKDMSYITDGKPAFFIFLLHNEKIVLTIGNAGAGVILRVSAYNEKKLPKAELDMLISEVLASLSELGLEFRKLPSVQ